MDLYHEFLRWSDSYFVAGWILVFVILVWMVLAGGVVMISNGASGVISLPFLDLLVGGVRRGNIVKVLVFGWFIQLVIRMYDSRDVLTFVFFQLLKTPIGGFIGMFVGVTLIFSNLGDVYDDRSQRRKRIGNILVIMGVVMFALVFWGFITSGFYKPLRPPGGYIMGG